MIREPLPTFSKNEIAKKVSIKNLPGSGLLTGTTVVTVTFKNIKTAKTTNKKYRCVVKAAIEPEKPVEPIVEATKISTITQKEGTKFEVTLSKVVSSAALADFSIVRDESNAIVPISGVTVDTKDATKVELVTYESLVDGKTYTVTYTATDEAKTKSSVQFTATDGTIDSLNLTPLTITAGKATTIKYQTIDKNGVILSEKSTGSPATGIEVNTTYNDGYYTSAGNLYLANVDDIATIVLSYHTYKYDTNGLETGVIEKTFTVKAVDSASVAQYDYTIAKEAPFNWDTTEKSTKVAMDDDGVYKAYLRIKDVNGETLNATQLSDYTVESSNNNILVAAGTADAPIALAPVAQGTAYLVVSKDGKNVASLPVNVVGKRVLTTVKVENASVTVATDSAVLSLASGDLGNAVVSIKTLDQYGVDISADTVDLKQTSKPSTAVGTEVTVNGISAYNGKLVVSSSSAPAGTYGYKITIADKYGNEKSGVFSVKVVAPGSAAPTIQLMTAEVDAENSSVGNGTTKSIDTTFCSWNHNDKNIEVYAVGLGKGNVIVSGSPLSNTVSVSAIKVTGSDGTVYAASGAGIAHVVTSQAIDETAIDNALATGTNGADDNAKLVIKVREDYGSNEIRKYLPAGSYTVTYTVKDATKPTSVVTKTFTSTFTVKDEQAKTTVKVIEPSIGNTALQTALTDEAYAVFSYDGVALLDAAGSSRVRAIKAIIGANTQNGAKATVQYVVAKIPVTIDSNYDGVEEDYTIDTVVPVNVTFSGVSGNLSVSKKDALKLYPNS